MRYLLIVLALAGVPLAGCQSAPPPDSGVVYGPPCGYHAVDNGLCPRVGYRQPIVN
ncbi:MAG: hypothetical protein KKB66_02640 [Alphaproteobacteria bacterium]|jgi:hypothetical protein|nr:hypothetical protein [Alphaproteobacteria bacterium]MBU0802159.1 hypothetical protein [Alphaproteobacteria bacterium]MBU0872235.1 hypothetical protein [Alphaproteobacteria bacterium]MBU1399658.1 hypothetical protein [Alphaproteobacteria bacterium]MBU1590044.1 hypothetical protein [Alphaproteobacteria bacterium]